MVRAFICWAVGICLLYGTAQAASNPDAVAVIIGNRNYEGRVPDVSFAHRDADAIRAYVVDVLGYDPDNLIDLRDATKAQMETTFGNARSHKGILWRYLDPGGGSDVTIFYSGHGVPGQSDGRGYLLPSNANPDTAELNGYPIDLLYENLGKLETRSVTVMLDACFSGDSPQGMLIRSASPVFVQSQMPQASGALTVADGRQRQPACELGRGRPARAVHAASAGRALWRRRPGRQRRSDRRGGQAVPGQEDDPRRPAHLRPRTGRHLTGNGQAVLAAATGGSFPRARPRRDRGPPAEVRCRAGRRDAVCGRRARERAQRAGNLLRQDPHPGPRQRGHRDRPHQGQGLGTDRAGRRRPGLRLRQAAERPGPGRRDAGRRGVSGRQSSRRELQGLSGLSPTWWSCRRAASTWARPARKRDARTTRGRSARFPIGRPFAIGKYEVTVNEFSAFVNQTGYRPDGPCHVWMDGEWKNTPGTTWLNPGYTASGLQAGRLRQLERRQGLRAVAVGAHRQNHTGCRRKPNGNTQRGRAPTGCGTGATTWMTAAPMPTCPISPPRTRIPAGPPPSAATAMSTRPRSAAIAPTHFGLHDTMGNVFEWTEDCKHANYSGGPTDGSAWIQGGDCVSRVLRGGSWYVTPPTTRSANRVTYSKKHRYDVGFRVAMDLQ